MSLRTAPNTVIDECDSTNTLLRAFAEQGMPHGTWISARKQNAGRGRLGRSWSSSDGNLFLSILVRPKDQASVSWIPLAAAVSIVECLRQFNPRYDLRIKWPNDLWLNGAKVGGILCEGISSGTSSGASGLAVVIGIGLNCASAPENLDQPATRLSSVAPVTADEIRQPILTHVLEELARLQSEGVTTLRSRYDAAAVFRPSMQVSWVSGERTRMGEVAGLGPSGELEVMEDGERVRLYAEDVKIRRV